MNSYLLFYRYLTDYFLFLRFNLIDLKIAVNTRLLLKDRLEGIGWIWLSLK